MLSGLLTLLAVPATADPRIRSVWRNANDVLLLRVDGATLHAVTTGGDEWSLPVEELRAAFEEGRGSLTARRTGRANRAWLTGGTTGDGAEVGDHPANVSGFPVTAARRYRGVLYLATFGGVFHENGDALAGVSGDVRDLAVAGDLLVAGLGDGLSLSDGEKVVHVRVVGPPSDNISSLATGGGELWVGYFDGGLARFHDRQWDPVEIPGSPRASWVNTLCWDDDRLWIGTEDGVWEYRPDWPRARGVAEFEGRIQSIRKDGGSLVVTGSRWIAVRNGGVWERLDRPWDSLHTAFLWKDELQAGGMAGVLRRRNGTWRRYSELTGELPDSWVTAVYPVGDRLWVGTYDAGLGTLERDGSWKPLRPEAWVNPNAITGLPGRIAVGTQGDGLLLYDFRGRQWSRLAREDGLPGNDVTSIEASEGGFWVGTRSGLAYLETEPAQSASRDE